MKKKLIAKLLVLAMVLSIVPVAFATANEAPADTSNSNAGQDQQQESQTPVNSTYYAVNVDTTVHAGTTVGGSDVKVDESGKLEVTPTMVNGTATVTLDTKAVEALAEQTEGDSIVLVVKPIAGATKYASAVAGNALAAAAEKTGKAFVWESPVATVTIPSDAIAAQFKDVGTVKISAQASGANIGFSIAASGRSLQAIKGLTVEF